MNLAGIELNATEPLRDKVAVITGGTGGVGKEIASGLARLGAKLVIVGRDGAKGAQAVRQIDASSGKIEFLRADLSLVREARRLGDEIASRWSALHYLVHSAGIVRGRRVVTTEGIESNFATNYLSRFVLTNRLLPSLQAGARPDMSSRIVLVAHPGLDGEIHYDDVNLTRNFSTIRAFRQFHYANDVFAVELARRLAVPGERPSVAISCLHPGPTKTNIDKEMPLWMKLIIRLVVYPFFSRTPDVPAAAALKLLSADEFEGNAGALFSLVGQFRRLMPSQSLQDPTEGARLWAFSEGLVRAALEQAAPAAPA